MTTSKDDANYKVGFGKPPKHTQFKKGQSGNPKGRPKGSKNVGTILHEQFFSPLTITDNGRRKKIPIIEGIIRVVNKHALEGDRSAWNAVIKLLPVLQAELERARENQSETQKNASANDRAVLETLASMFGRELDDLEAIAGEEMPDD